MKMFLIVLSAVSTIIVNAQCYSSLTQSQNKLLDEYNINYTGLQTRFIMSTNRIDRITDLETKNGMIKSYSEFNEWRDDQFQIIPDTNFIIETGADYVEYKNFTEDAELLKYFFNESHHILQKIHFDINRNNIKSIEILEYHMTGGKGCTFIRHMVLIEDYSGVWFNFLSDDNDTSLECPFCTVP